MSIIERMKNCEGCQRRRTFLKKLAVRAAGAVGLAYLWPSLAKACSNCESIFCTTDDSWIVLCCEDNPCDCANCFFVSSQNSLTVCTPCPTGYKCFGTGCGGFCPPKVTCVNGKPNKSEPFEHFLYYWKVTMMNDNEYIVGSDDPGFDIMTHFSAGLIKVIDKEDKRVWAKATKRLPENPKT